MSKILAISQNELGMKSIDFPYIKVKYQYPINAFSSVCYSSKLYNSIMEAKILFLCF